MSPKYISESCMASPPAKCLLRNWVTGMWVTSGCSPASAKWYGNPMNVSPIKGQNPVLADVAESHPQHPWGKGRALSLKVTTVDSPPALLATVYAPCSVSSLSDVTYRLGMFQPCNDHAGRSP